MREPCAKRMKVLNETSRAFGRTSPSVQARHDRRYLREPFEAFYDEIRPRRHGEWAGSYGWNCRRRGSGIEEPRQFAVMNRGDPSGRITG